MRRRELKADKGPEVDLPIVPFLDMSFQILFFFIMNYHPSALEGQMDLNLPAAGEGQKALKRHFLTRPGVGEGKRLAATLDCGEPFEVGATGFEPATS